LTNGHVVGLGEKSAFPTNGFPPVEGDLLKNGIFGKLGWLVTSGWDFTENPTLQALVRAGLSDTWICLLQLGRVRSLIKQ
jgi:hypothetical protein